MVHVQEELPDWINVLFVKQCYKDTQGYHSYFRHSLILNEMNHSLVIQLNI